MTVTEFTSRRTHRNPTISRAEEAGLHIDDRAEQSRAEQNANVGPVTLNYWHVNQAERFQCVEMEAQTSGYLGHIPTAYTSCPYPLL